MPKNNELKFELLQTDKDLSAMKEWSLACLDDIKNICGA